MLIRFKGPVKGIVEETGQTYVTDIGRDYETRNSHLLADGGVFAQLETRFGLVNISCGQFIWEIGESVNDGVLVETWPLTTAGPSPTAIVENIPAGVELHNNTDTYPNNYPRL